MTTAAMSSCPVDVRFDLDEVLSTVMDGYSMGQRMNEVNSLISQLPLLMDEPSDENNICTICREDFSTRERLGRELVCTHIYHHHCIVSWLALDASCPLCRCIIFPNESV
uniref:RING-type domain-containing protein n=1 Tax=Kalanchoe fedtschenkoi TaxID=63787 RepID=A0A7N1A9S1_KALFE